MLSVVIPTCNRDALLCNCLSLLSPENQRLELKSYEVIVTDDSNGDRTKVLIENKYPWVKWVRGPAKGPAANRNNAAKHANGQWLVFIDDDCLPDRNILQEYLFAIQTHRSGLVFEGCIRVDKKKRSFCEESPINESGGYLWSCNFMLHKSIFFDVLQGFDEGFPYAAMEDVDLAYRLNKNRVNIIFLKKAFVIHPWREQTKTFSVTLKRFESALYFLKKHPEKAKDLNAKYFLRISFSGLKSLFKNSIRYKFRGFGAGIMFSLLHVYFAIYIFSNGVMKRIMTNYSKFILLQTLIMWKWHHFDFICVF